MPARSQQLLQQIRRLALPPGADPDGDAALLQRFVGQREESAFAALVARHGPLVLGVCRRVLREPAAAEDAFQATFLVLARKAGTIRPGERLAAWLYGVARRLALQAQRSAQRRQQHESKAVPAPPRDPLDELTARELLLAIDEEIQRLPANQRLPILLCCLEGRSQEEAAQQLGWTVGSVKGRLERGRQRLHARLVRRGLTLGAALAALETTRAGLLAGVAARTTSGALEFAGAAASVPADVSMEALTLARAALRGASLKPGIWLLTLLLALGGAVLGSGSLAPPPPGEMEQAPDAPEPPAKQEAQRLDLDGEPLPAGAQARLGSLRWRTRGTIFQFAFSPDGKTVAATNGQLTLWDTVTGRGRTRPRDGLAEEMGVAFSPDGKVLVSGHDGALRRWDLAAGKDLPRFQLTPGLAYCRLYFSPDGTALACVGRDREESRNHILLLEAATGEILSRHDGRKNYIEPDFAFAPDGKTWAYADRHEKVVFLFETRTGELVRRFEGHAGAAWTVAMAPDGATLASTDAAGRLRFWDTATGAPRLGQGKTWARASLAYRPDGKALVSWGLHGRPVLLDPATGQERRAPGPGRVGESVVLCSPDGRFLATSHDHCLHLWNAASLEPHLPGEGHARAVSALTFSADSRVVITAGGDDGHVRRWEAATGKALPPLGKLGGFVYGCALAADGRTLAVTDSGGRTNAIAFYDLMTDKLTRRLAVAQGYPLSLAFAATGPILALGQGQETLLWDWPTGKLLHTFPGGEHQGRTYALAPDGRTIAVSGPNRAVHLMEIMTGKELRRLDAARNDVTALAFSPDSKVLATGSYDAPIRLWDAPTGALLGEVPAKVQWNGLLVFSPDGRTLASGTAGSGVWLWEVRTGKERWHFAEQYLPVRGGAFSRDGRLLATGSADTTVLVWDLAAAVGSAPAPLSARELDRLWTDLADADARTAFQAIMRLAGNAARAVPFLKGRLPVVPATEEERTSTLLADLASERFATRTEAMRRLEALGGLVEPALRRTLAGQPTAEVRLRVQQLLDKLDPRRSAPELQNVRAIEALERSGDRAARQLLHDLAQGAPDALRTREARAALERLPR